MFSIFFILTPAYHLRIAVPLPRYYNELEVRNILNFSFAGHSYYLAYPRSPVYANLYKLSFKILSPSIARDLEKPKHFRKNKQRICEQKVIAFSILLSFKGGGFEQKLFSCLKKKY